MLIPLPALTGAALGMLQLTAAQVAVQVEDADVTVRASYALAAAPDSVRFVILRTTDREIVLRESVPRAHLRTRPGLYEIVLPPGDSPTTHVRLHYAVVGSGRRIPLPVPDLATAPGSRAVEIDVTGLPDGARLNDGFPRFSWTGDGIARARLENLPSLIHLPPRAGQWSFGMIADLLVVGLVIGASVAWWSWRRLTLCHRRG